MADQIVRTTDYDFGQLHIDTNLILNVALRAKKLDQISGRSWPATARRSGSTWAPDLTPAWFALTRRPPPTGTTLTSPPSPLRDSA